jgi:PAS domain S-box-containing protein
VIYRKQKNLDLVMSTEYQNLLFTQALGLGCAFCIMVRRDGTIVYSNDGLSKLFPRFDYAQSQALEGVFEQGIVRMADRDRLMAAIHSGSTEHLIFPIFNPYNEKTDYIITVEPLVRPSGFSIVRGREYLGKRAGMELMPDILRSTSIDKLDRLLSTTPVAHYNTDAFGRFEYVNPAFERLFGYEAGEILASKLSLHHLIFSFGSTLVTEEYSLADYGGESTILHKRGARQSHPVVQFVMRDTQNKLIGATGSVFPSSSR